MKLGGVWSRILCAVLLGTVSCTSCVDASNPASAIPIDDDVRIVLERTEYVLGSAEYGWRRLVLSARLENRSSRRVEFEVCEGAPLFTLERLFTDGWRSAWESICAIPFGGEELALGPETSRTDTVVVEHAASPNARPVFTSTPIEGTYRLVYWSIPETEVTGPWDLVPVYSSSLRIIEG